MSGRSPSGPGSRASHEAASASSPKASIPNAVADKLDKARALIERGWTREAFARGKSGRELGFESRAAVCFCAVGAIRRIDYWNDDEMLAALKSIIGVKYTTSVFEWNDAPGRTQAEVIDAFKRAAELARAGEQ